MTCSQHRTAELRQRGFRMTPQRQAILRTLDETGGHLSPSDIYNRVRLSLPGLTEATVYRTLDFLAKNEMVNPAQTASGHLVYEISGDDHHHLICRVCGREVQVEHAWVRSAYEQIEVKTNYHLSMSHLTFFGVCPDCIKA
jgi:Fe2+ or Zn2+ uptake regulation protein